MDILLLILIIVVLVGGLPTTTTPKEIPDMDEDNVLDPDID